MDVWVRLGALEGPLPGLPGLSMGHSRAPPALVSELIPEYAPEVSFEIETPACFTDATDVADWEGIVCWTPVDSVY